MSKSNIEWTQDRWNPIVGCSILSPGCTNCYAMTMAARIEAMNAEARETEHASGKKKTIAAQYDGTTKKVNGNAIWTGKLALAPESTLLAPLKRKRPTTYFVNSMGDLFHEDCPDEWIDKVFAVMALCPQHTFQVLTKRAKRMRDYVARSLECIEVERWRLAGPRPSLERNWPLPNVWLGVSTERQKEADERIPELLATPAAVRFISAEPLLGPIDLDDIVTKGDGYEDHRSALECDVAVEDDEEFKGATLDWVIVGGESGPGSRPMHPDWARSLRDQCAAADVPFFFKQWGEWQPRQWCKDGGTHALHSRGEMSFQKIQSHPDSIERVGADAAWQAFARVGKQRSGRLLDGILHDAMPTDHRLTPARRERVPA